MFKWYGFLGAIIIVLMEINFFVKIQPFANWYFPIIWIGYILLIDSIVYKLRRRSLINNYLRHFIGLFIISAVAWWMFEFLNNFISNWSYSGIEFLAIQPKMEILAVQNLKWLYGTLSFSTVLPAFMETVELIKALHLFDKQKLHKKHKITKNFLFGMVIIGMLCFILPLLLPKFAFPLIWLSFFFIIDPINYLNKQPSIIQHLKDRRLVVPLSLLLAGIILGILWEFWNYWALPKWSYDIPFIGFFKIFEMPILGYLGYFPFAFELYALYWFVRSLFVHKEHILAE